MEKRLITAREKVRLAVLLNQRWERLEGHSVSKLEASIRDHLYGLFSALYVNDGTNVTITRSQVRWYMRCEYSKAKELLEYAAAEGFVTLEPRCHDHRAEVVVPTQRLRDYIEADIKRDLGEVCLALGVEMPDVVWG